jgi:LysR family transcriptional regulator, glycine cleavage system transcriptional activator
MSSFHSYWSASDIDPPTWQRWLAVARRKWRNLPDFKDMQHLSFREELHAIEAVTAGQGIGIFSNVLVASELASGTLVKAFNLSLPGYRFYVVRKFLPVLGFPVCSEARPPRQPL